MIEEKDTFADALGIEPMKNLPAEPISGNLIEHEKQDNDIETDYRHSRSTYYRIIEQGENAIEGILAVANETQHPRAYEVAATLLKNMADVNDKLMALQKMRKELQGEQPPPTVNIDKAVFVGSTADLLKKIKNESSED